MHQMGVQDLSHILIFISLFEIDIFLEKVIKVILEVRGYDVIIIKKTSFNGSINSSIYSFYLLMV